MRAIAGGLLALASSATRAAKTDKSRDSKSQESAAPPEPPVPVAIEGYSHYALLPVTAPDLKMKRVFMQSVSDRLAGRMAPILFGWNTSEKIAKDKPELGIALIIDRMKGVSGGSRVMWGAFAGDADIAAHVELIEQPSGKVLARQMFYADRKAWTMQAMATEYLVLDDLVNQVVNYLSQCYATRRD